MKKKYICEGFDCPNCASKYEEKLSKDEIIESVSLNCISNSLVINYKSDKTYSESELMEIANNMGEEVTIKEEIKDNKSYRVKVFDKEAFILIARIAISLVLLLVAFFAISEQGYETYSWQWWVMLSLYIVSYLIISYDYIIKVVKSIIHLEEIFGEATLMVVASLGAFAIQEFPEAVLVMLLAQVGELFEDISVNRSHNLIVDAIDMRPKTANKVVGDEIVNVPAEELEIDDIIMIKLGEVVPTDGVAINCNGEIDTSSITGEFAPVAFENDAQIYSGSVLTSGTLTLRVTKAFHDSTTSKILDMVVESGEHKSKAEKFISKFAKIYTPIVGILAVLVAIVPPIIIGFVNNDFSWTATWYPWIYTALTLLVISCPCSIVISVPLAYFTGVGLASKRGIVVKGANYLDRLNDVETLVTDKTGTLTTGEFSIVEINPQNISKEEFEYYLVSAESKSGHPIAKGILNNLKTVQNSNKIKKYSEIAGFGIEAEIDGKQVLVGNEALLNKHDIAYEKADSNLTILYVSVDNVYCGYVTMDDTPKENSAKAIKLLSDEGVKTLMLTGGRKASAEYMSNKLGITEYYSDLLPEDKIAHLKEEIANESKGKAVAFVGDGVNDAPSIILADVGIAMGGLGSDASVGNADVVIMNDDPLKIVEVKRIAKATRNRSIFIIAFALIVKLTIMILALIPGVNLPMWVAVLADSGLAVLMIIVAFLLVFKKIKVE